MEAQDKAECPCLSKCVFFNDATLAIVAEACKKTYCKGDYGACARYQMNLTGQAVPDALWPNQRAQDQGSGHAMFFGLSEG